MSLKQFLSTFVNKCKLTPDTWTTVPSNLRCQALMIIDGLEACGLKVTIDKPHGGNAFSDDVDLWARPGVLDVSKLEVFVDKL